MPFVVGSIIPAVLIVGFACAPASNFRPIPRSPPEPTVSVSSILSPSLILTACGTAIAAGCSAALDPTLALRLTSHGFDYSATTVGGVFSMSSVAFTFLSKPIGWCCDRFEGNCRIYKVRLPSDHERS